MATLKQRSIAAHMRALHATCDQNQLQRDELAKRLAIQQTERLRSALSTCLGIEAKITAPRVTIEGLTFEANTTGTPPELVLIEPCAANGGAAELRIPIRNLGDLGAHLSGSHPNFFLRHAAATDEEIAKELDDLAIRIERLASAVRCTRT